MTIQSVNPNTNNVIESFEETTPAATETAIARAHSTFDSWRKTSYKERAFLLHKVAAAMRTQKESLSKTITSEMGKLIAQAQGEIDLSADIIDYYADHGEEFLSDKMLKPEYGEALVRSEPIGALLGIMPWNFPFYQVARFAAPNVMAGNTILLKHAANVPQSAIAIETLFKEAGAPSGLYTNLILSAQNTTPLVADKRIKGISLTGSERAGMSVAAEAGRNVKKVVLELGGSDAFIILEDADIDKTVEWAVVGRMNNNGQCCVASKRFIAVEAIADEFLQKFKDKLSRMKVGDPMDPTTQLGPLCTEAAAVNLMDQVKRSVDAGATVLLGGRRSDLPGAFIEPTILSDLKPNMPAYYEELFGPVASFYRVKDENAAIDLANDSAYGLGGSVFTRDIERGKRVADKIDTGMVFINHPTWTAPGLPFGGTKLSGFGRELSELGIQEFINKKLIRTNALSDPF